MSSRVVKDEVLGSGRNFVYTVQYSNSTKNHQSWTLMPEDIDKAIISVGDTFIWQYSSNQSSHYNEPRYFPLILNRLPNGQCQLIKTDFSYPVTAIDL